MTTTVITFYNNIGGVSKTTTLYNLAAYLSKHDKKTLIVDCDPRSSVTGLFFASYPQLKNTIDPLPGTSIYDVLKPRFDGSEKFVDTSNVILEKSKEYNNLYILRGDLDFYMAEGFFARAWINAVTANAYAKNTYVALNLLIRELGNKRNFDYVLCDVGACPSYTTRLVLLSCDKYFIPLKPDRFNSDSVRLLTNSIGRWISRHHDVIKNVEDAYLYDFPQETNLLGGVLQFLGPRISNLESQWINMMRKNFKPLIQSVPVASSLKMSDPFVTKIKNVDLMASIAQKYGVAIFDINEKQFYDAEEGSGSERYYVSYGWDFWKQRAKEYEKSIGILMDALQ